MIDLVIAFSENNGAVIHESIRPIRDDRGRVRVWDPERDTYGWAELNEIEWTH